MTFLLDDLGDDTGADGLATLADGETETALDGDGDVELDVDLDVVTRHDDGLVAGEGDVGGDIRCAEEELGSVVVCERGVAATLVLGADVERASKLLVGFDAAGGAENLATLDLLTLDRAEQGTHVVAGLAAVELLVELQQQQKKRKKQSVKRGTLCSPLYHLNTGDGRVHVRAVADNVDFVTLVDDTALNTSGDDGATAGNREDVLNAHEEGFVELTLGRGDVVVDGVHQLDDGLLTELGVGVVEGAQSRTDDHGQVVAVVAVLGEDLTKSHT